MSKVAVALAAALLVTAVTTPLIGCSKSDEGLTPAEQSKSDRLDEIAKKSGGDWAKVSQADRDYLINNVSSGNENSAKMLLMMKSGHFKGPTPQPGSSPAAPPGK